MNIRKSLILSLTIAAFAAPGISSAMSAQDNAQNSKTRAEVISELNAARQNGTYVDNVSRNYPTALSTSGQGKTRAAVVAEVQAARQDGTLVNNVSRNYPNFEQGSGSQKTRAEVKNELMNMSAAEEKYLEKMYRGS
jgi:hypothetical protein